MDTDDQKHQELTRGAFSGACGLVLKAITWPFHMKRTDAGIDKGAWTAASLAFWCSILVLATIIFGFARIVAELPIWVCLLIAIPGGFLALVVLIVLHVWADSPR